jgi:hypothetical protein
MAVKIIDYIELRLNVSEQYVLEYWYLIVFVTS